MIQELKHFGSRYLIVIALSGIAVCAAIVFFIVLAGGGEDTVRYTGEKRFIPSADASSFSLGFGESGAVFVQKEGENDSMKISLSRWGGAAGFVIHIPAISEGSIGAEGAELSYEGKDGSGDVVVYPRDPEYVTTVDGAGVEHSSLQNEYGGIEFDIVLNKEPASNSFRFPIEAEGLSFHYQYSLDPAHPTWADDDGDGSADRVMPENVVGSYAVYYNGAGEMASEAYKAGKVFHVYRPRIFDDDGVSVWGDLLIEKGMLTISVDKEWLANADYPVTIDPNFGYESVGATTTGCLGSINGMQFIGPEGAELDSVSIYATGGAQDGWGAIYDEDLNLIGHTPEKAMVGGWNTYPFSVPKPSLDNNDRYWLVGAVKEYGNAIWCRYDVSHSAIPRMNDGQTCDGSFCTEVWPESISSSSTWLDGRIYSVYGTYTYTGAPGNLAPNAPGTPYADSTSAQAGQASPASATALTPVFSAVYTDANAGDTATGYEIEVWNEEYSEYEASDPYETGKLLTWTKVYLWQPGMQAVAPIANGSRSPDITYAGPMPEHPILYWHIRFRDAAGAVGYWSETQTVMTGYNTIGYTPQGSSGTINWSMVGSKFSAATDGILRSAAMYIYAQATGRDVLLMVGIYEDNGGAPGAHLGHSDMHLIPSNSGEYREFFEMPEVHIEAGHSYWLVAQQDSPYLMRYNMSGGEANQYFYNSSWEFGSWADAPAVGGYDSRKLSLFAIYDSLSRPVANNAPTAPSGTYVGYPSAQSGVSNPVNFAYATPFFSAVYNDPNAGDHANAVRIQLTTSGDAAYATPLWDSEVVEIGNCVAGSRCEDIFYGFPQEDSVPLLEAGENYRWRVKFYDDEGAESPWSADATISMKAGAVTSRFYVAKGDGFARNSDVSWDTGHDAASGDGTNYSADFITFSATGLGVVVSGEQYINRGFLPADTSRIPDTASVTGGAVGLYVNSTTNDDNDGDDWTALVQTSQASTSSLVAVDYSHAGTVNDPQEGSARVDISSISAGGYARWDLNATGAGWVDKAGYTKIGMREGHDCLDRAYAGAAGTSNRLSVYTSERPRMSMDPYLEVTYSGGAGNQPPNVPTNPDPPDGALDVE